MKRKGFPLTLRGGALSLSKEPAMSDPERAKRVDGESNGPCGKLSVVNNFALGRRFIIHHSKFFSERVINNGLSTTVNFTGAEIRSPVIRAMLYNLCPLRYD